MKTLIILILISITSLLNAQPDRILHSATLDCYMDLGKIVRISELHHYRNYPRTGLYGSWAGGKTPDSFTYSGCWYFTIFYEIKNDCTYHLRVDTTKAYQVYNRIVSQWKAYIEYSSPPQQLIKPEAQYVLRMFRGRTTVWVPVYFQSDTITLHKPLRDE